VFLLFFVQRPRDTEARQGVRAAGMHIEALSRLHSAISQTSAKNHMFSGHRFVKMYYFAIEFQVEMPYPLAPAWENLTTKDTKERKGDRVIW
jgi:hypothetical protein